MDQSDSVPMVNYERNLGKRRRRSEGEYLGKNEGEKGVCNSVKCEHNLGKQCRCSEGKNLEKNEGEKGVYNLVVSSDNLGKRRRCSEGKNLEKNEGEKGVYNLVKFECNLGKRRRCCEGKNEGKKGVYNLLDRISAMPDEILVSLLSLLPLKEAAATSILSRRWQYVWMSTMVLNFDANFDVGSNICRFGALKQKLRDLESGRYVNWVNRVVEQHRGPNIEEFSVCFQLNDRFTSSIDKWVQFAIEKGVTTLVLKFFSQLDSASLNFYAFPHKLLGLEKKCLYSYIPSLRPCGYKVGFQSLKVLHFNGLMLLMKFLNTSCPTVQFLNG